jgi:hypothetical protein
MTLETVSPGKIRKLTTAEARLGITLSLVPAWQIVAADVVRNVAFESRAASKVCCTTGPKSHIFLNTTRIGKFAPPAAYSRNSSIGPCTWVGIGGAWILLLAVLRIAILESGGGTEECPPAVSTESSRLK